MDLNRALDVAVDAVQKGGELARMRLGDPGFVTWKGQRDVVCEASFYIQNAIAATIQSAYPNAGILAEEGPEDAPMPVDAPELWIIDPICGSLNFVQGIPYFAVSLALRAEGSICAAVVYDPCRDELFAATLDGAATLNGENIHVQQFSEGIEAWSNAIVGTDWPRAGERREQARTIVGMMMDQVNECSLMGSPALGICNVACGRMHAYWHLDLKIWDIAAPSLILQRAGGVLTDARGNTWLYSDGGYIATNAIIHGWALNCIQAVIH
jgi:myo-inositol-1(or 4)-monophosphatase